MPAYIQLFFQKEVYQSVDKVLRKAVVEVASTRTIPSLPPDSYDKIKEICDILGPLQILTDTLQADTPTAHLVIISTVQTLKSKIGIKRYL